jgi:ABC-type multidrug transport system ATPase subunit
MLEVIGISALSSKNTPALEHVGLSLGANDILVLSGPPGSGKTTLLEILLGWRTPSQGRIVLRGQDITRNPMALRLAATYVSGTGALVPSLALWRNAQWLLGLVGVSCSRPEIVRALRMADVPDRSVSTLARLASPQECFGVWLAIARLRKSALLLLDDPTRDMGTVTSAYVAEQLDAIRTQGAGILLATRDPSFCDGVPHHVQALNEGRLVTGYDRAAEMTSATRIN